MRSRRAQTLLDVDFRDATDGEGGSGLRLFNPTKRASLKLSAHAMSRMNPALRQTDATPPQPTSQQPSSPQLRADAPPAFFVEHLSGLDFSIKLSQADRSPEAHALLRRRSVEAATQACARVAQRASSSTKTSWSPRPAGAVSIPPPLPNSVALLPYWDGAPTQPKSDGASLYLGPLCVTTIAPRPCAASRSPRAPLAAPP